MDSQSKKYPIHIRIRWYRPLYFAVDIVCTEEETARGVKKVTMELGGKKSPLIIFDDVVLQIIEGLHSLSNSLDDIIAAV